MAGYSSASRWIAEQLEIARRTANEWIRIGQTAKSDTDAWPLLGQQRADALTEVLSTGGTGTTTEVIIHVRGNGATLDDGTPMTMTTVAEMIDGAFIRALIHDAEGRPINASSKQRHPTARQRRVVKERVRHCVDCGSTELLEYDHVPDFAESHRTVVDELELRCSTCHAFRHRNDTPVGA